MKRRFFPDFSVAVLFFAAGCATVPPRAPVPVSPPAIAVNRYSSLVRVDPQNIPIFEDDVDTASLRSAALQSQAYYQNLPSAQLFVVGADTYTAQDLAGSMAFLVTLLDGSRDQKDWLAAVRDGFAVYQSVGVDAQKTVVFSSYYEPTLPARLAKDKVYKFPLYARPPDLIDVDLSLFDPAYQGARISGRREGRTLIPYATRADIDGRKILQDKQLEIAWAKDPVDVLDLQIEGSGWLDITEPAANAGGSPAHTYLRIHYDGDNGRRYKSVGQHLIASGRIPAGKFSRSAFLQYLARHPEERQQLLNVNERYIFFRIDTSSAGANAYGNLSVPLTPWRSMATDPKLFPKGALAWIDTTQPVLETHERAKASKALKRFMLNQDEGGAIQGPGRVDIFAGQGSAAKAFATQVWNKGKLYFLVKKKS